MTLRGYLAVAQHQISDFRFQIPTPGRQISAGDFRFQISDPRRHKAADFGTFPLSKISASPENSMTALLQISAQRRRSQIAQITSHRRCAREKEKSGAAVDIWRLQIPAKEIPFFSASCGLRILSEGADPHFAVPEFCRAGSMPSRSPDQ